MFKEQAELVHKQRVEEFIQVLKNTGCHLTNPNGEYKTMYEIFCELSELFKKEVDTLNDNPASKCRYDRRFKKTNLLGGKNETNCVL